MDLAMKSQGKPQWACIKENVGIWNGSFLQFSADGEVVKDTPSVLTLEETTLNQTLSLTLERMPEGEPKKVNHLTFTYPGLAPYTYFFESGAFSQGAAQWTAFGQFVNEYSLKVRDDRRVRFVVAYDSTQRYTSAIKYVTLICETQTGGSQFNPAAIAFEEVLGEWTGTGEALMVDVFKPDCRDAWTLTEESLLCHEQIEESQYTLSLEHPEVSSNQAVVHFTGADGALDYQLMLLPKGAYCFLPKEIKQDSPFRLEVGWISEDSVRSRFIRYYDKRGVWTHSALFRDEPVRQR